MFPLEREYAISSTNRLRLYVERVGCILGLTACDSEEGREYLLTGLTLSLPTMFFNS